MGQSYSSDSNRPASIWTRTAKSFRLFPTAGARSRRKASLQLIRESSLFDADWYRSTYPDVQQAGVDPLLHYFDHGWREGRNPGPDFNSSSYLRGNPDVASLGVNPLLHYVEFGRSEGREFFGGPELPQVTPPALRNFAKANPCASFVIQTPESVRWLRSYRLDRGDRRAIVIADQLIGYASNPIQREKIPEAFALLAWLSGAAREPLSVSILPTSAEELVDAWIPRSAQLRTRWKGGVHPFVVRAYQHDPQDDGTMSIVGERLVESSIDPLDSELLNPFFPILFVFSDPDGKVRGARLLTFPSLCRGGVHYPEMLAAGIEQDGAVGPLALDRDLSLRLIKLIDGRGEAAVKGISVDIAGADGLSPMFQADFQLWLEKVMRVEVGPTPGHGPSKSEQFLAHAVSVRPAVDRGCDGATLVIRGDMVPMIGTLTAAVVKNRKPNKGPSALLLIPKTVGPGFTCSIQLPIGWPAVLDDLPTSSPSIWPRFRSESGLPEGTIAGAIRLPTRARPTDADLLAPVAHFAGGWMDHIRVPITWLILPSGWEAVHLEQAINALALQDGGDLDRLAFAEEGERQDCKVARARFGERFQAFSSIEDAAGSFETPLTGFVSPGVILHDNRTATLLSAILENQRASTASSPVIEVEGLGKDWRAAIAEGVEGAELFWGETYPVAAPTSSFWVARSSDVYNWVGRRGDFDGGGFHICSSVVTVSRIGRPESDPSPIQVPYAPHRSINIRTLVG